MKKYYLLLLAAIVFCLDVNAQISVGGQPLSFTLKSINPLFEVKTMPALDIPAIIAADEARGDEPRPYKFGEKIPVDISLQNSGTWEEVKKGRLWRIGIRAEGAFSLNFIFNDFYMPEGATLFIYNEEKDYVLGAFTSANNQADRLFGTDLVKGDMAIIEYYEPAEVRGKGVLKLQTITHGFRNLFDITGGGSGSCNNDINCPGWEAWQDDKRSVGIIIVDGSGGCTGTMVVDVPQSGTPYFLTANHCMTGSPAAWVYRFNYEHTVCNQSATPVAQSVTGSVLRASSANSDFALLELNTTPPANYNVYYAGWTNDGLAATQATAIHHPSGDVKKISRENNTLVMGSWGGTTTGSHWEVSGWDDGVTEPGSSGSGLWDQNHRIVGQLHGGASACGGNDLSDQYGKFSVSWTGGGTNSSRLSNWLDPQTTGTQIMNGWDPNAPTVAYDARIAGITTPVNDDIYCSTDIAPVVVIKNSGTTTLTNIDVSYNFDGGTTSVYNWSGSLATNTTATVTLPLTTLAAGAHTFTAATTIPGANPDENTSNDTLSADFSVVAAGNTMTVHITTDGYGDETTWSLRDSTGAVIYSGGPFGSNETTVTDICVPGTGCYTFTMYDSFGDGMCCQEGNGSYRLEDENGYDIATGGTFTSQALTNFCLPVIAAPPVPAFISDGQQICEGMHVIYTNQTTSSLPATYAWTFQGGTPSSSTNSNPNIAYPSQGTFDVRLIATNQFGSDTILLVDYVTVIDAPVLTTSSTVDHIGVPADGTATVNVINGTPSYIYSWSNGESSTSVDPTNTITGLAAGNYNVLVTDGNGCEVSKSVVVTTNTGIEDQPIENLVQVYPNPAKDLVTIEIPAGKEAKTCELYNVIGAKMESFAVNGKQRFQLDLGAFAKGVYFLRINVGGQLVTKKIVLSK